MRKTSFYTDPMHRRVAYAPPAEKAQSMVEFALVLPLLLVLVFGVIEFGRMLFVYSAVYTASREAARYGSAAGDNGSGTLRFMDCSGMIASASRVGVLANITAVNISYDSGPGTASVSASCPPSPGVIEGGKNRVVVEVRASYQTIVPLIRLGSLNFQSRSARTIFSNIQVGRFPPNPAHIADLDATTVRVSRSKWNATVTIFVKDEEGNPVENAIVTGQWNLTGNPPTVSCSSPTNISGICSVTEENINKNSVTFSVADIVHVEKSYDPTANSNPDGDNSNGTVITISEPP